MNLDLKLKDFWAEHYTTTPPSPKYAVGQKLMSKVHLLPKNDCIIKPETPFVPVEIEIYNVEAPQPPYTKRSEHRYSYRVLTTNPQNYISGNIGENLLTNYHQELTETLIS